MSKVFPTSAYECDTYFEFIPKQDKDCSKCKDGKPHCIKDIDAEMEEILEERQLKKDFEESCGLNSGD